MEYRWKSLEKPKELREKQELQIMAVGRPLLITVCAAENTWKETYQAASCLYSHRTTIRF
jgi:hypothetical protein